MQKRIELSDCEAVERIRRKYGKQNNSHSFNALFVWRDILGDTLFLDEDTYSLNYTAKGENTWLFPVGSLEGKRKFIDEKLGLCDFSLCFLNREDVLFLEAQYPDVFLITHDEKDDEYLYDLKDHFELESATYYSTRKKVNRAKREHDVLLEPITKENLCHVKDIISLWKQRNPSEGELSGFGREIENITLNLLDELKYEGYLMYVDQKPYGFKLGYALSDTVFDSAIENTILSDSNMSVYMFVLICEALYQKGYTVMNLEEDAGIEGLKTYKESLKPNEMLTMYIAKKK